MNAWSTIDIPPSHDGDYLVYIRSLDQQLVRYWDRSEMSFSDTPGITHWRYLPAPPEPKED